MTCRNLHSYLLKQQENSITNCGNRNGRVHLSGPRILNARFISRGWIVTRFACIAHRFTSSKRAKTCDKSVHTMVNLISSCTQVAVPVKYASVASCKASMALLWNLPTGYFSIQGRNDSNITAMKVQWHLMQNKPQTGPKRRRFFFDEPHEGSLYYSNRFKL